MAGLLVAATREWLVDPGAELYVPLRVRNTGTVVDRFTVQVLGSAKAWAVVEPHELNLFPGAEGEATLVLRPPREAGGPSGVVPVGLRLASDLDPQGTVVEEGSAVVGRFVEVGARLVPKTSRGRRSTRHRIDLANSGNVPVTVGVSGSDPDDVLRMRTRPASVVIAPRGQARVRVGIRSREASFTGPDERRAFTVTVAPEGAAPMSLDGAFRQRALLGGAAPKLLAVVALLLVAVIVVVALHDAGPRSQLVAQSGAGGGVASATAGAGTPGTTVTATTATTASGMASGSPAATPVGGRSTPVPPPSDRPTGGGATSPNSGGRSTSGSGSSTDSTAGAGGAFHAMAMRRLADTRGGSGYQLAGDTIPGNGTLDVTLLGQAGIPSSGVEAVALSLTIVYDPSTPGYLVAYPAGTAEPQHTVSVFYETSQSVTTSGAVEAPGGGGKVTLSNHSGSPADAIVDVEGWFDTTGRAGGAGSFVAVTPARIADTRSGNGTRYSGNPLRPGAAYPIQITGTAGVPSSGVAAVAVGLEIADTTASSSGSTDFLAAFATNVSSGDGSETTAGGSPATNLVLVPVGADGAIQLVHGGYTTNAIVDVYGWFSAGSVANGLAFTVVQPQRVCGNNSGDPASCPAGKAELSPGDARLPLGGSGGVPRRARAVVASLSVDPTGSWGFLKWSAAGVGTGDLTAAYSGGGYVTALAVTALDGSGAAAATYGGDSQAYFAVDALGYFS